MQSVRLESVHFGRSCEILGEANELLSKWAAFYGPKKFNHFRNDLFNKKFDKIKTFIPKGKHKKFESDCPKIFDIKNKKHSWLDNRTIELAIFQNYIRLANKLSSRWVGLTDRGNKNDMLQESYTAIVEAMYQWNNNSSASLTTYIWWAINRRLSTFVLKQNTFASPTNEDKKLIINYNQIKNQLLVSTGHSSHEEICKIMKKKPEELSFVSRVIYSTSGVVVANDESDNDYSSKSLSMTTDSLPESIEMEKFNQILIDSGCNELEKVVMNIALRYEFEHGWKTLAAKEMINSATGKPYSKMRIAQIYTEACHKIHEKINFLRKYSLS